VKLNTHIPVLPTLMVRVAVPSLYVPLALLACIRTTLPFPFPEVLCVLMMYVSVDVALVMLFR